MEVVESQVPPVPVSAKVSKTSDPSTSASSNENSNSSLSLVPERKNSLTDKPGPSRYLITIVLISQLMP